MSNDKTNPPMTALSGFGAFDRVKIYSHLRTHLTSDLIGEALI